MVRKIPRTAAHPPHRGVAWTGLARWVYARTSPTTQRTSSGGCSGQKQPCSWDRLSCWPDSAPGGYAAGSSESTEATIPARRPARPHSGPTQSSAGRYKGSISDPARGKGSMKLKRPTLSKPAGATAFVALALVAPLVASAFLVLVAATESPLES